MDTAQKFDLTRASEYETQSRIALAGYDAFHELAACMLTAALGTGIAAEILVGGAGGGAKEIVAAGGLEPGWHFTAVDPSPAMMDLTVRRLNQNGLIARTDIHVGYIDDLSMGRRFDGATLIGILHHLHGDKAKRTLLKSVAARLKPGAPLILAGNRYAYASKPLLLAAWGERWRMIGASPDEVKAKLGVILQGADPPSSEEAVVALLEKTGFQSPTEFFSSLFWAAWFTRRTFGGPAID